jgi:hypothetical protein
MTEQSNKTVIKEMSKKSGKIRWFSSAQVFCLAAQRPWSFRNSHIGFRTFANGDTAKEASNCLTVNFKSHSTGKEFCHRAPQSSSITASRTSCAWSSSKASSAATRSAWSGRPVARKAPSTRRCSASRARSLCAPPQLFSRHAAGQEILYRLVHILCKPLKRTIAYSYRFFQSLRTNFGFRCSLSNGMWID